MDTPAGKLPRAGAVPPEIIGGEAHGVQLELIFNSLAALVQPPVLHEALPVAMVVLFTAGLGLLVQWKQEAMEKFHQWQTGWQVTAVVCSLVLITSLGVFDGVEFIYFRF